jgi:hypothetical protein
MPNENWKDATNRVVLQTDLIMMVLFGAHERSRTQLESVLAQSGFKMDSVIPVCLPSCEWKVHGIARGIIALILQEDGPHGD